jgi:hypothetical protein
MSDEWLAFVLEVPVKWALVFYVLWSNWPVVPR